MDKKYSHVQYVESSALQKNFPNFRLYFFTKAIRGITDTEKESFVEQLHLPKLSFVEPVKHFTGNAGFIEIVGKGVFREELVVFAKRAKVTFPHLNQFADIYLTRMADMNEEILVPILAEYSVGKEQQQGHILLKSYYNTNNGGLIFHRNISPRAKIPYKKNFLFEPGICVPIIKKETK